MDHSYVVFIGFWIQRLLNKLVPELTKHTSWRTVEFFSPPLFFGNPELTWCWGAGCGWCWAPAALVGVCASKAACVLGHWHSVKGCGASCFGGCSMCPSRRLGSRGRGFETGNSAALPPGSSAGNTAHPQTRGSTNKDMKSHKKRCDIYNIYIYDHVLSLSVSITCVWTGSLFWFLANSLTLTFVISIVFSTSRQPKKLQKTHRALPAQLQTVNRQS